MTSVTCGRPAIRVSSVLISPRTAGLATVARASNTIDAESPRRAGKLFCSRLIACCEPALLGPR